MLTTENLFLHPLSLYDLELLSKNELKTFKVMTDLFADESFRWAFGIKIENMKQTAPETHVWYTSWGIIKDNTIIGFIGFKGYPLNGKVEIGYSISKHYRRKGYMSESVVALLSWAQKSNIVEYVVADATHHNTASNKVLQKCGFKHTYSDDKFHYYSYEL